MEKGRGSLLFRRAPVLVEVGLQQAVHQKGGQAQKDHLPPDEPQKQRPQQAPAKIRRPGGHHRQGQAQPDPQFGQVGVGKAPGILVLLRQGGAVGQPVTLPTGRMLPPAQAHHQHGHGGEHGQNHLKPHHFHSFLLSLFSPESKTFRRFLTPARGLARAAARRSSLSTWV